MKRILVGVTYYYPNISGVSQYAKVLAEELAKNSKVEIISSRFRKELAKSEMVNGVNVERIDGWQINKGILMWQYPIKSFWAVKRNEIINCHLPSMEAIWLAFWAKILRKKLIITHHCEFSFSGNLVNRLISVLSFVNHYVTYLLADKIIAYTKDYADNSLFLRLFKKKLVFILPPIKLEESKKEFNFGKGKIVAYVGRIAWEKGLNYLIESMKKNEAKLILAGPINQVIGDQTYETIKKNLGKNIEIVGPIEHKYLKNFYQKIDCLVLPSINNLETFGIVQAEAMKCGIPVVASNLPGVRVPIQMTDMGEICEIKNSKDLKNKIDLVLKNGKEFYKKRARNLDKFDYHKTVGEYEKLFEIN